MVCLDIADSALILANSDAGMMPICLYRLFPDVKKFSVQGNSSMASINTNASAMTALQSLRQTNKAMEKVQTAISTGFRVAEAKDNAAYWSIATTMRSDNAAMSTVQDALGLGSGSIDVASTAIEAAIKVGTKIKTKLIAASQPGVDKEKVQAEITELQAQLEAIATSASFTGDNWLSVDSRTSTGYNATKSIVSSFTRDNSGITIGTTDINITKLSLYDANPAASVIGTGTNPSTIADGIIDTLRTSKSGNTTSSVATIDISVLTDSDTDLAIIADYADIVDLAITDMIAAASTLGAVSSRIDLQTDFISNLMDAIDRGIGQLVDADMNKASVKLQALQVQQQLGIQALSIANGNSQNILSLFRN